MSNLKIFTDGGSRGNPGPAGIGICVIDEDDQLLFTQSLFIGRATNNEAEYKAFLASLEWLKEYKKSTTVNEVKWFLDSKLVVEQVNQNWKIKEPRLKELAQLTWKHLSSLDCKHQIVHVKRELNKQADELVNKALDAIE